MTSPDASTSTGIRICTDQVRRMRGAMVPPTSVGLRQMPLGRWMFEGGRVHEGKPASGALDVDRRVDFRATGSLTALCGPFGRWVVPERPSWWLLAEMGGGARRRQELLR